VPPGGAAIIELGLEVPGKYLLVDHAISRVERGLVGNLIVEGPDNPDIYRSLPDSSGQ
jgi:nitrite reductase (NO-forming)